jgi:hypothetical protein
MVLVILMVPVDLRVLFLQFLPLGLAGHLDLSVPVSPGVQANLVHLEILANLSAPGVLVTLLLHVGQRGRQVPQIPVRLVVLQVPLIPEDPDFRAHHGFRPDQTVLMVQPAQAVHVVLEVQQDLPHHVDLADLADQIHP